MEVSVNIALVSRQGEALKAYTEFLAAQGATVVADGRDHPLYRESDGFFLGVSLIDNVTPAMDAYKDEIFGPVLSVMRVDTYEEAVKLVNDNPYGNGTAIFTRDGGAARQFQFDVNVGMVGINVPIPVPVSYYSFGGWKASLFGDTHMYGPDGVQMSACQAWGTHTRSSPRVPSRPAARTRSWLPTTTVTTPAAMRSTSSACNVFSSTFRTTTRSRCRLLIVGFRVVFFIIASPGAPGSTGAPPCSCPTL